jgi:hypothetical protein
VWTVTGRHGHILTHRQRGHKPGYCSSYPRQAQSTKPLLSRSIADPGCFISDPDPTIFSSRIRIQTYFNPGSYMKCGMQTYFFLVSYAFRSKVLGLVILKKIRDPVPGGKKVPDSDPQHCFHVNVSVNTVL